MLRLSKKSSRYFFKKHPFRLPFFSLAIFLGFVILSIGGFWGLKIFSVFGASTIPPFVAQVIGQQLSISDAPYGYTEAPPWIVPGGWRGYMITTNHTMYCPSPKNMLTDAITFAQTDCVYIGGALYQDQITGAQLSTIDPSNDWKIWKRNYYGAMTGQITLNGTSNAKIIAINHGENKNEYINGNYFQNTINTNIDVHNCSSGFVNGTYQDCYSSYNAFIGLSYIPYTLSSSWGMQHHIDLGPIIWPAVGYLNADDSKASMGVRHPSSLIYNNEFYVFYLDTAASVSLPTQQCIKAAKAPIDPSTGLPGQFMSYYQGGFSQASLPAGFTKETASNFLKTQGPLSDCLFFVSGTKSIRFSVAKINGSSAFVGVEEYNDNNNSGWHIALRYSTDLVNWSDRQVIASAPNWSQGLYHYPIFLRKDDWTNNNVDQDLAYIEGTDSQGHVQVLKIQLQAIPTPTPIQ